MRDRHERLNRLLDELAAQPGVRGAALVSRDGLGVKSVGAQELARETFSAMSATLMGAAEIAMGEIDPSRMRFVVAQTDRGKAVVIPATPDLLLVVYADANAPLEALVSRAQAAAGSVATVVAG